MKVLSLQGDPVEAFPQSQFSKTVYASTTYVPCDCCIVRSEPVSSTMFTAPLIGGHR